MKNFVRILAFIMLAASAPTQAAEPLQLLNVSYDPTREFYEAYNPLFASWWKQKTGQDVKITQSHGGSGHQARSVIEGLRADVVTLALAYDIDAIADQSKLLPDNWQSKLPQDSCPYSSAIVFLVRAGNPKHIQDWDDLIREGVTVITPNPKTSGGARWNYLAAWGYALKKNHNDENAARAFMAQLFKHVPMLDAGARGATATFAKRGLGDVLIAWENEALLTQQKMREEKLEIVIPSLSISAEPPVAVIEENAKKKGTLDVAQAYLEHLYSKEAQELIAANFYRPVDPKILHQHKAIFQTLPLLTIKDFGGWREAQAKHFADGGLFDQIYMK